MKEQWRSSPQPREQEPPAAQQSEAIPGVDAAPGEISRKETVCEGCGRPYGRTRELGEIATKGMEGMAKKGGRHPKEYSEHRSPDMQDDSSYDLTRPFNIPPEKPGWHSAETVEAEHRAYMRGKDGIFMANIRQCIIAGLLDVGYDYELHAR